MKLKDYIDAVLQFDDLSGLSDDVQSLLIYSLEIDV